jgi:hypothetical protein
MKNINVPEISFIFDNDKTEVFSRMAMDNFRKHLQVMIDCMGNDLNVIFMILYMNMVMDHIIYITKPDLLNQ